MKSVSIIAVLAVGLIGVATARVFETLENVYCLSWTECNEACEGGRRYCPRSNGKEFAIDCHLQSCEEIEDCGRADIVFVLDESTSIAERNYWVTKQFCIDVMKGLNIAAEFTRIGMVTYSDKAITHWDLTTYPSEYELENAIWLLPKTGGTTHTTQGLEHAHEVIRQTSRPDVKHIVVVITDGHANWYPENVVPQAEKMHADGIEIFAIGIGNDVKESEVRGMASELKDEHYHLVPDYNALVHITNVVINETCRASNMSECDDWSDWGPCEAINTCGPATKNQTQECRFYNYPGDPNFVKRVNVNTTDCWIECPSTVEPPRDSDVTCTECDAPCDGVGKRHCVRDNGHEFDIPCVGEPCGKPICPDMDIVFILDSSNSIGFRHWVMELQFVIDVTNHLPLESTVIQIDVGTVTFSAEAKTEWVLGEYDTRESIKDKLEFLEWAQKTTNSQDALKEAKKVFDTSGRPGIQKVAVFISDGESNVHPDQTIPAAQALHDDGINVFAIAVRPAGIEELKSIASEPVEKHYLQSDTYAQLFDLVKILIEDIGCTV